jgi:uncharacterized protein YbgA (DUF1722 family)/uncharacterized protein YbbK (DUF523 family)
METVKLGISACLLGENVRYDGGHKLDHFLRDTLGQFVAYVPVCPEVECGLGVPRESMRLVGDARDPRLVTTRTHVDQTERMKQWAAKRVVELEKEGLCGFIFKANSPSSGMERVRIYTEKGMPTKTGVGLFARAFMEHFPLLPVEEEGRLHDAVLRENFIESLFVYRRWREACAAKSRSTLAAFHASHKLLVLSHSPKHVTALGRIVAHAKDRPIGRVVDEYQNLLMEALKLKPTPAKHVNVLHHLMGYFKKQLTADEKQELLDVIESYRNGHVPLIVPVTLVNHYVRKYDQAYLREQLYLTPHPIELQLRNHA